MARTTDFSVLSALKGRSILRLTDLSAAEIGGVVALALVVVVGKGGVTIATIASNIFVSFSIFFRYHRPYT
jgi:hypothetical protein